jgi:acyl-CoA synthetase (AMP-forming)/AMP-acid ligase II
MLKFSPSEIESVIDGMDFVVASSVVGVPDEVGFDVIYAFVKRKSEDLKEEDVVQYVQGLHEFLVNLWTKYKQTLNCISDRVPKYQRLRGGVIFVDEFPLSITGKILKRKLRERVLQLRESEQ